MDIRHLSYAGKTEMKTLSEDSKILAAARREPIQATYVSDNIQNPGMVISAYNVDPMTGIEYEKASRERTDAYFALSYPMDKLTKPYQKAMEDIAQSHPSLVHKDWDLGVNKNDELIIFQGNNKLSSEELNVLTTTFDNLFYRENIKAFQDASIKASFIDFRLDKEPGSVSHYNLNTDNINDVLRARDFMNAKSHQTNPFDLLRDQMVERGSEFIKPEAADMKLVDIYT